MKKKKILIVDDNEDILDALNLLMTKEGYEIETTIDGNSLLQSDFQLPDLILLDAKMSNADGRKICLELRKKEKTREIPIIIFSAAHEIEESAIQAGADDFLAKPFLKKELVNKIEKLTRNIL